MTEAVSWPRKTRELQNHHLDSRVWNEFPFRDHDIIIATYAKSGTTWMQQIVGQLLFRGDPDLRVAELSPWLDMRLSIPEKLHQLAAQTHRRIIKTHLPADALVISPRARFIYIARDGRDVVWSFYNHHRSHTLPNVLLVHFANLRRDMPGEIRRIAGFLEIRIDETRWDAILEYCSFDWMKANAAKLLPGAEAVFEGGGQTFIHRGLNGRWSKTLTLEEVAEYEARAVQELGPGSRTSNNRSSGRRFASHSARRRDNRTALPT